MNFLNFSTSFHQRSKRKEGYPPILAPNQDAEEEQKTTYYKTYPRLPKIDLGDYSPTADLFSLIKKRKSRRNFSKSPLTKQELAILLKYSCGNTGPFQNDRSRRAQPSSGSRFPIEIYPVICHSGNDLQSGLYHYNVKTHQLDILWERHFSDQDLEKLFVHPWAKDAVIVIVMTAVFWRTQNKYSERGYRYILLEAGHIGQNLYLVSEALGLKCCALGGVYDESIEKLIDIDGVTESVVYAVAVGK